MFHVPKASSSQYEPNLSWKIHVVSDGDDSEGAYSFGRA